MINQIKLNLCFFVIMYLKGGGRVAFSTRTRYQNIFPQLLRGFQKTNYKKSVHRMLRVLLLLLLLLRRHLIPAFLTAPRQLGHMLPSTSHLLTTTRPTANCHLPAAACQPPPVNCQLPPATCQLSPVRIFFLLTVIIVHHK